MERPSLAKAGHAAAKIAMAIEITSASGAMESETSSSTNWERVTLTEATCDLLIDSACQKAAIND